MDFTILTVKGNNKIKTFISFKQLNNSLKKKHNNIVNLL